MAEFKPECQNWLFLLVKFTNIRYQLKFEGEEDTIKYITDVVLTQFLVKYQKRKYKYIRMFISSSQLFMYVYVDTS